MNKFMLGVGIGLAALTACSSTKTATYVSPSCDGIKAFFGRELTLYQNELDDAARDYQIEQWMMEMADKNASPDKLSKTFTVLQEKTYRREILAQARDLLKSTQDITVSSCPAKAWLDRALVMLETSILVNPAVVAAEKANQEKQDAFVAKSNAFRMSLPGEKEPISKALYAKKLSSTKDRAEREKLYRAFNSARPTKWNEWGFKELIKSRNAEGVAAGFANFYEYRFFRGQLDFKNYRAMLDEVKAKLGPKVRAALQKTGKQKGIAKIEPWDMGFLRDESSSAEINEWLKDLKAEKALDLARDFYKPLGIDIDSYKFMMDLYPRNGKNTHAFAMSVVFPRVDDTLKVLEKPKMDIRFCANLKQPVKWDDVNTVIHELAHAIHAAEVRQPIAIFRGTDSVSTEAIAMLTERMASSSEYFEKVIPKITPLKPRKIRAALRKTVDGFRFEQAFVLMRQAFFSDFEYHLYANPDADFAGLWSRLHKEWWGVDVAPSEAGWDVEHFVMAPVYVQNYAIGILMVEQFHDAILKEFKTSFNSVSLGDKLKKDFFAPGTQLNYLELTQRFTGAPLSATAALNLIK